MRVRRIVVAALAVALPMLLSGCAAVSGLVAGKPNVVTREATVSAVGAPVQGALVAGFPSDVPLWPGALVVRSGLAQTPQGKNWSATLVTKDPYQPVLEGMGLGLEKAGWKVESQDVGTTTDPSVVLTITRATADGLITLSRTVDRGTSIEIVVTPK